MRKLMALFPLAPILLAPIMLASCASLPPVVQDVRLSDSTLTLVMSNGAACHADWRAEPGEVCGYQYQVTVDENPNPLRKLSQDLVLALGGHGLQPPLAEVVLTDAQGRAQRFTSPKPVDLRD